MSLKEDELSNKITSLDEDEEEEDDDENDENFDDYYRANEYDFDCAQSSKEIKDPEYFDYECLNVNQTNELIESLIDEVCSHIQISRSYAKILLYTYQWNTKEILDLYFKDKTKLFSKAFLNSDLLISNSNLKNIKANLVLCKICLQNLTLRRCDSLCCGHLFCIDCWQLHLEVQIQNGFSVTIQCMEQNCFTKVPEDFALNVLKKYFFIKKYKDFNFKECVNSNPLLRECTGTNCSIIFHAKQCLSYKVQCKVCLTQMCFKCSLPYHAPTDCYTIKQWLTKCADDSETANYISANTKDCPKCHVCIEKNGGCNHMMCAGCKHEFCWICFGDWKSHGSEYYECSRFVGCKESKSESSSNEAHLKAREALKKYLFYYERWENHARSLRLEEQTLEKIKARVQEKVYKESSSGSTWIDWQYLLDAAALLAKCRYTLQYTYPYAYYMNSGPRKQLFEYQQAQLEAEIEALSWKVERAETYDRGEMENQMDVAEKRRSTLLKDFLPA